MSRDSMDGSLYLWMHQDRTVDQFWLHFILKGPAPPSCSEAHHNPAEPNLTQSKNKMWSIDKSLPQTPCFLCPVTEMACSEMRREKTERTTEEEKKGGGKKRDDNMKNNVWMLDEMKEADPNKNLWHGVHQWEQSKDEEEVRKQLISNRSILWVRQIKSQRNST